MNTLLSTRKAFVFASLFVECKVCVFASITYHEKHFKEFDAATTAASTAAAVFFFFLILFFFLCSLSGECMVYYSSLSIHALILSRVHAPSSSLTFFLTLIAFHYNVVVFIEYRTPHSLAHKNATTNKPFRFSRRMNYATLTRFVSNSILEES